MAFSLPISNAKNINWIQKRFFKELHPSEGKTAKLYSCLIAQKARKEVQSKKAEKNGIVKHKKALHVISR